MTEDSFENKNEPTLRNILDYFCSDDSPIRYSELVQWEEIYPLVKSRWGQITQTLIELFAVEHEHIEGFGTTAVLEQQYQSLTNLMEQPEEFQLLLLNGIHMSAIFYFTTNEMEVLPEEMFTNYIQILHTNPDLGITKVGFYFAAIELSAQ